MAFHLSPGTMHRATAVPAQRPPCRAYVQSFGGARKSARRACRATSVEDEFGPDLMFGNEEISEEEFMHEFDDLLSQTSYQFEPGQRVEGLICDVSRRGIFVDFGAKNMGFCSNSELSLRKIPRCSDIMRVDTRRMFEVRRMDVNIDRLGGKVSLLSRVGIVQETAYKRLRQMREFGIKIEVTVLEKNPGGYMVEDEMGLVGFLPTRNAIPRPNPPKDKDGLDGAADDEHSFFEYEESDFDFGDDFEDDDEEEEKEEEEEEEDDDDEDYIYDDDDGYFEEDDALVGETITVLIVDLFQESGRYLVTQRGVEVVNVEDSRFAVGTVLEGVVQGVLPYGVFVDTEGLSGLLHSSQVSSGHVEDLSAVFKEGDVVKVMILGYDRNRGRLSLSTKRLEPTPGDMLTNPQLVYNKAEEMAAKFRKEVEMAASRIRMTEAEPISADISINTDKLIGKREL